MPLTPMVTVNGCADVMLAGDGDTETVGVISAAFTLKVTALEVPPPGDGLVTVIAGVPALATSVARMAAVSWLALM